MDDLVSVVIPIYNVQNYLRKCLNSILSQTYKNTEIILVDDGSTDDSGTICDKYEKYDSRIIVVHKKNGGLSDARNVGIDIASGKYITFIDSDDYVSENYIEELYKMLIENNADISSVCLHYVNEIGRSLSRTYTKKDIILLSTKEALKQMMYQTLITNSACTKLYKIDLFKEIRYPVGELFEDIAVTYKLFMKAKKIVAKQTSLYHYFVRTGSISKNKFTTYHMSRLLNSEIMIKDICKVYPDLKKVGDMRLFAAAIGVVEMISNDINQFPNEYEYAISVIKKTRSAVIFDKKVSKRLWLKALLSYISV